MMGEGFAAAILIEWRRGLRGDLKKRGLSAEGARGVGGFWGGGGKRGATVRCYTSYLIAMRSSLPRSLVRWHP